MKATQHQPIIVKVLCIILVLLFNNAYSQEFDIINSDLGLSSNNTTCIVQDKEGIIWIATTKGLNSFDGYEVKSYLSDAKDNSSLIHNNVQTLCITNQGLLIAGTRHGISVYNKQQDNFSNYLISIPTNTKYMLNYINKIAEDKYGNLWVASAEGFYKFNVEEGTFLEYFNYSLFYQISNNETAELKNEGIPNEISNKISTLNNQYFKGKNNLSDKLKTILGEIDYNKYSTTILDVTCKSKEPFFASSVNTFTFDDKDNIWLGLSNGHLIKTSIQNNSIEIMYLDTNNDIESNLYSLLVDGESIWCGKIGAGMQYDIATKKMIKTYPPTLSKILNKQSLTFLKYHHNEIWMGTARGLYLYNKTTQNAKEYKNEYYNSASLSSDLISDIFIDMQQNVWIATQDGGVCRMKSTKQFKSYARTTENNQHVIDNKTTSVLLDKKGRVWSGQYTGGINIFDKNGQLLTSYEHNKNNKNSLGEGTVTGIIQDRKGDIWASTYRGGLQKYDEKNHTFKTFSFSDNEKHQTHAHQLFCDSQNNLWVSVLGNGIYKINNNRQDIQHFHTKDTTYTPTIKNNWLDFINLSDNNKIRFGEGGFIYEIEDDKKAINKLIENPILYNYKLQCFYEDTSSTYYIGTQTGLLTNVNSKTIEEVPYFKDLDIVSIQKDNNGKIWLGTDRGLYSLTSYLDSTQNTYRYNIRQYGIEDGIPSNNFIAASKFKTTEGELFFGTEKGAFSFIPDNLNENPTPPNILLTDFKLFNQSIKPDTNTFLPQHISQTTKIELEHTQNFISFNFAAINFINPEGNQYAYKLEGVDDDWIYCGNKREANYTKLRHGTYLFKVKASNNDNIWNESGVSVTIIIDPPFWKTNLAMFLYSIFILGIILILTFLVRYQEKFKAKMEIDNMNIEKDNDLNKMKLKFFTNISHEFRTPLTLIIGPLEGLLNKKNEDTPQLQLIFRNAQKLLKLIDEILDVRKLNSGKMQLKKEPCDLALISSKIVDEFKFQCNSKQLNLSFTKQTEILDAFIDISKYETILNNLLSNAIKHTPKGGNIEVQLSTSSNNGLLDNAPNSILLTVQDSGCGIPEEDIEHVFERFYQSKNSSSGGSGIGLTLVKELTEIHGGTVTLESKVNMGSLFSIKIPLAIESETEEQVIAEIKSGIQNVEIEEKTKTKEDAQEEVEAEDLDMDDANPLILVVEDNDEVRNYIKGELKGEYRVIEATNGAEGYDAATTSFPDIIISDVMMPEMDGMELTKKLKSEEKTSHIPIILLTAYNNENTNVEGYETGAESFLAKPFSPKVLRSRINNILKNRDRLKEKFSNILYAVPSNRSISAIDEQFINKAINIVETNLVEEGFNIEFLCKEMGYSRTALYSKIKALTDQSISEFIKLIRLKKAIEFFQKGQNTVNEVAFLVGFKTHSHFSRCFQEEFNMSPSEYLEKLKKQ